MTFRQASLLASVNPALICCIVPNCPHCCAGLISNTIFTQSVVILEIWHLHRSMFSMPYSYADLLHGSFMRCCAGPISKIISTQGMKAVYEVISQGKQVSKHAATLLSCDTHHAEPDHTPADTLYDDSPLRCCAGPISKIISTQGMKAVYEALDSQGKQVFEQAYAASYGPAMDVSTHL